MDGFLRWATLFLAVVAVTDAARLFLSLPWWASNMVFAALWLPAFWAMQRNRPGR